jgi:hypothetical protein
MLLSLRSRDPLFDALLSSEAALAQAVFNEGRRRRFTEDVRAAALEPARAKEALLALLNGAAQVDRGDTAPLGIHGDLTERATTAARGAVLLVIEKHTADIVTTATMPIERTTDEEHAYRIALDDRPLFELSATRDEAVLHVDARPLTKIGFARGHRSAGDLARRLLFAPALQIAEHVRDVRCVAVDQGGLTFAGDVAVVIALAEKLDAEVLRPIVDRYESDIADAHGRSSRTEEIEAERTRLQGRLADLERAESGRAPEGGAKRASLLLDSKRVVLEQLERLQAAADEERPPAPRLPVSIGYGPALARVAVGEHVLWFGEALADRGEAGITVSGAAVDAFARAKRAALGRASIDLRVRDRVQAYDFFHTEDHTIRLVLRRAGDDFRLVTQHDPLHAHLVKTIGEHTWGS